MICLLLRNLKNICGLVLFNSMFSKSFLYEEDKNTCFTNIETEIEESPHLVFLGPLSEWLQKVLDIFLDVVIDCSQKVPEVIIYATV